MIRKQNAYFSGFLLTYNKTKTKTKCIIITHKIRESIFFLELNHTNKKRVECNKQKTKKQKHQKCNIAKILKKGQIIDRKKRKQNKIPTHFMGKYNKI